MEKKKRKFFLEINSFKLFCSGVFFVFIFSLQAYQIKTKSLHYRTTIDVRVLAEESKTISVPVAWLPISFLVKDGQYVKESEKIAEFDSDSAIFQLNGLLKTKDVIAARLDEQLQKIDSNALEMQDNLKNLFSQKSVLKAKLTRLKSLPNPNEVKIAAGRLKVAKLNALTGQEEYDKAQQRYKNKLISMATLEHYKYAYLEKNALKEYAQNDLDYTELTVSKSNLEITEFKIENVEMEIEKLKNELKEHKNIAKIKRKGAKARLKIIETKIEEKKDDIKNTLVLAPAGGYIKYANTAWRDIELGAKLFKNMTFLKIPQVNTLEFKGVLSNADKKNLRDGDTVTLFIDGKNQIPIKGSIKNISPMSHDLAEKDSSSRGTSNKEFGVKVFDVVISSEKKMDWIKPGMRGRAEIESKEPIFGPAIPLRYLISENNLNYIYTNKKYKIKGTFCDGFLIADNEDFAGMIIRPYRKYYGKKDEERDDSEFFSETGTIIPTKSIGIYIGRVVWPWPKVKWLEEEHSTVKKGDIVAKLDTTEIDKKIKEIKSQLEEQKATLEEEEKEFELMKKETKFTLRKQENLMKIAELNMKVVLNALDYKKMFSARLSLKKAKLNSEKLEKQLLRYKKRKKIAQSPDELNELERNCAKAKLNIQKNKINLLRSERGAGKIERSKAHLDYLKQANKVRILKKQHDYRYIQKRNEIKKTQIGLSQVERRLRKSLRRKENYVLKSPADGIIIYEKIWNSGEISKVNTGSLVGSKFRIMSIPDLSQMSVSIDIPEYYYSRVQENMKVKIVVPSLQNKSLNGTIEKIGFLFHNKKRKDSQSGLYSSHEPLGEVIFKTHIKIDSLNLSLKPGSTAKIIFPF
ncbi:MAG: HlyD family efflux transporter periplasmic adaptor subunit [Verrucomicrobiota bacterium]|nr:HlyD family efflux transporter periplasmic adaptor subunit [Verrucomicrobiota bacterium]